MQLFFRINKNNLKLFLIGGSNQAVSSLTTFFINFYLLAIFSPESFGLFGIGFAIILFFGAIGDALLLTQMVVIYPSIEENEKNQFVMNIFAILILFCLVLLIFMLATLGINTFILKNEYFSNNYIMGIAFASIFFMIKEYLVRVSYNERKETFAVYMHSTILLATLLTYFCFYFFDLNIDVSIAFSIFALTHFVGIIVGILFLKIKPSFSLINRDLNLVFKQVWLQGKWACLTNIVMMLRLHAYTIIAALLFDVAAVGNLNAARIFITPALIIIPVVVQLSMPRLSSLRENNILDLFKKGKIITWMFFFISIGYSLVLLLSYNFISSYFLNKSYENLYFLIFLWCVYALSLAIRNGKLLIIQVLQKFKKLSFIYIISSVVTLIFSYFLAILWNLSGIIMGLIIGEILIIYRFSLLLQKERNNIKL